MPDSSLTNSLSQALRAELDGRDEDACNLLRQVVAAPDCSLTLNARLQLGRLLLQDHRHHDEAQTVLHAARELAHRLGTPRQAATAIHLLAKLKRDQAQLQGKHLLDEAQQLLDDHDPLHLPGAPGPEVAQWFHFRGLIHDDREELADAERRFFRAHELYREINFTPGLAQVSNSLANLMLKQGKSHAALECARFSLRLKEKLQDHYGQALSLGCMGLAYLLQARYEEAREVFRKDLDISTRLNNQRGIGIVLNCLGETELALGNLGEARRHYQQNLDRSDCAPGERMQACVGLTRVHLLSDRLDEAAASAGQLEELLGRYPVASNTATGLTGLPGLPHTLVGLRGTISWRRGDLGEGERLLRDAIASLESHGQNLNTLPFLYELRDLYQRQANMPGAIKVMRQALDLLDACGSDGGVRAAEQWLRTSQSPELVRLALEQQLPEFVVEEVLRGQLTPPKPTRQEVAVLFCDVRDYTSMSEGLEPETVVELLNEWFGIAARAIRQHNGVIDKFIGDAVMALFGVPKPYKESAADAVRAALAMRDALSALNLRHKALGGRELRIGVGIHTGPAVVGQIGSRLRKSYTAIGDTVNTASRLESATKNYPGCDIIISEETELLQEQEGVAETEFLGHAALKGKEAAIPVYKILGRRLPSA